MLGAQSLVSVKKNGFIITWILHQIIFYYNKVKLVAGYINDPNHPTPNS